MDKCKNMNWHVYVCLFLKIKFLIYNIFLGKMNNLVLLLRFEELKIFEKSLSNVYLMVIILGSVTVLQRLAFYNCQWQPNF